MQCGYEAELATRIYEHTYGILKSPIERIGFKQTPCPTARHLENEFYSNAEDIVRRVESMLDLDKIDLSEENFFSHTNRFKGPF